MDRNLLIQYTSENEAVLKVKRELKELGDDHAILKVKSRPIVYVISDGKLLGE